MTIKLLAAYDIYPQNAIVTLAAGTEAGLIAARLASATLTGGVTYVAPAVPPVINNARVSTSGGVSTIIDDAGNVVNVGGTTAVATATALGLVKGAGIAADGTLKPIAAAVNTRGFFRAFGVSSQVVEQQGSYRNIMKIRAAAKFSRVRMWVMGRTVTQVTGIRFAVAPTDEPSNATIAQSYYPRSGGVSQNVFQDTANANGWRVGTFSGGATSGSIYESQGLQGAYNPYGSYQAIPDIVVSDWVDCASLTALDDTGGAIGPLMLARVYFASGQLAASAYTNGGTGAIVMCTGNFPTSNDMVADLTNVPAASPGVTSAQFPYIAFEFDYDVKVRSFAFVGDSVTEGYNWPTNSVNAVTTPSKPYTFANLGMSTHRQSEFSANFDQYLKRGAKFTDVLFPSHSTNDSQALLINSNTGFNRLRNQLLQFLDMCDAHGIRVWLWTHYLGFNQTASANSFEAVNYIAWVRTICAQGRANLVDISAGWDKATMLGGDATHPNATGQAYMQSVFQAALIAEAL
jgi:hypothetical protein